MKINDISKYSRDTLADMLEVVLKQLEHRSIKFVHKTPPTFTARVEYPSALDVSDVKKYAAACLSYAFPEYQGDSPLLIENNALKGGARVFVGDDMVDVTFQQVEAFMKK